MITTYSTADVAELMNVSERWLIEQLRADKFPGRKLGRHWRMTEQDVQDALDLCANDFCSPRADVARVVGLTPRSRKRVAAS